MYVCMYVCTMPCLVLPWPSSHCMRQKQNRIWRLQTNFIVTNFRFCNIVRTWDARKFSRHQQRNYNWPCSRKMTQQRMSCQGTKDFVDGQKIVGLKILSTESLKWHLRKFWWLKKSFPLEMASYRQISCKTNTIFHSANRASLPRSRFRGARISSLPTGRLEQGHTIDQQYFGDLK